MQFIVISCVDYAWGPRETTYAGAIQKTNEETIDTCSFDTAPDALSIVHVTLKLLTLEISS